MTKQEAKELLPIIQAFAEGKTIQYCRNKDGIQQWVDVPSDETVNFSDYTSKYRIKPESKYRPFKNADECWQEMLKHQPFGWVKNIEFEKYFLIDEVTSIFSDAQIHISAYEGKNWNSFSTVFYNNTFADGTPFGIREC